MTAIIVIILALAFTVYSALNPFKFKGFNFSIITGSLMALL